MISTDQSDRSMTSERLAELEAMPRASFTNGMRAELIAEVRRLHALVATRPPTHTLTLGPDGWTAEHPMTCRPSTCSLPLAELAAALFDEQGEGFYVEFEDGWNRHENGGVART